jgi:beta-lactam-binding protein with PASTA domain
LGVVTSVPPEDGQRNQVLRQEPAAETEVPAGTPINLWIADPAEEAIYPVPNLIGREANAAISEVDEEGRFVVSIASERVYSDTVADGHIVSQEPRSGTEHTAGTVISVTLSRGPEVVVTRPMPNLNGETVAAARQALLDLNLTPMEEFQEEHSETVPVGRVIRTIPAAGDPRPRDGNVELVVSLGRDPDQVVETPPPMVIQRYPVRLPDRPGNVRVQIFQSSITEPIYDAIHSTSENHIFFEAGGSPDDIIVVLFDEEEAYRRPLGQLTPAG